MGRLAVPMVFRPSEPSPLDGILYAEAGWPAYLLEIQTRVIRKIAANQFCGSASSRSEGSHSRQGGSHSRRGVIHASDIGYEATLLHSSFLGISPLKEKKKNRPTASKVGNFLPEKQEFSYHGLKWSMFDNALEILFL